MKIFIKNMVCNRCISAVEQVFNLSGISLKSVKLGEAETDADLSNHQLMLIEKGLYDAGFERLKDAAHQLTEKIRTLVILKISELDIEEGFVLSEFLSTALHKEYSSLSKTFSQHESTTLEQFFILQKIEKVKELLLYNEFTLTEIAGKLGYKSVQHLSAQFRNITGFTPTEFRKLKNHHRKPLDEI
ncbi:MULTISPECIES: helix-turn-helix domain-containing protein [Chryseobacterium]|uniref:AraC-like DNA-binding protein n=1 Tax=Chryseobacterium camelliae TaxID=1265445 RepID=A0ABU0TGD9_9FLAO|nr:MULTISPECIES: helix-turn-helix domain-containing protein [Chryseobacterium]MDT3406161.1 AraC-like DNA-binding protein [Pseudacidovorax intermedius]MDQ1096036.1 AraC-like DNA-binding protein [Chryseobacterium camelliae]MDQ1099972.1 AraC-like DNA-binding protein [Chryseobacterium sp. SORGH_AS_1048]MDR6087318.1 AraC-like DNA-binding protein [Chryseobacterium sp. SORGH_AS_0909]MDR6131693.1 AraC-like DNA-binding protein [Chryseobacterium sp. SORGH_AS_1175]